ncbi:MAG: glutamate synthase subunit alpha, partial [Steroidobacteraceae bacterium]
MQRRPSHLAPGKQGLYDPWFEHEACGVGFVVDVKGRKSHRILEQAIQVLRNLDHRGACGCEANTGDGAGVLIQLPHEFFRRECAALGIHIPEAGHYGAGLFFGSPDPRARAQAMALFTAIVEEEGQHLLGWRDVPTDNAKVGASALAVEPFMQHVFIARGASAADEDSFERKLYVIRKRFE